MMHFLLHSLNQWTDKLKKNIWIWALKAIVKTKTFKIDDVWPSWKISFQTGCCVDNNATNSWSQVNTCTYREKFNDSRSYSVNLFFMYCFILFWFLVIIFLFFDSFLEKILYVVTRDRNCFRIYEAHC